jgi:chromate transporter
MVIAWELLRLGAFAFGGLGATLILLQRGLVDRRGWLQQSDISEALAFTRALPGSTGIQVVAYLCWRLRGWPGAVIGAIAFITPAMLMMMAVAAGSLALPDKPWVQGALTGIQIAVVGLLAASMWRLARTEARTPTLLVILLLGAVLGFFVHAVIVVVGAGLVGACVARPDAHG